MTLYASPSHALEEVAQLGAILPIEQFIERIDNDKSDKKVEAISKHYFNVARRSVSQNIFFPLKSNLSAGKVDNKKFETQLKLKPFAVVGDDELSRKWIELRSYHLVDVPIFVVETSSMASLQKLSSEFPNLKFIPSNGDGIGKELNVQHYPFLLTNTGIWQ